MKKGIISLSALIMLAVIIMMCCVGCEAEVPTETPVSTAEMPISTEVPTAVVAATKHIVTFLGGDDVEGGAPSSITAEAGEIFTVPENEFLKSGYEFYGYWTGWDYIFPGNTYEMPAYDLTFTAQWKAVKTSSGGGGGGGGSSTPVPTPTPAPEQKTTLSAPTLEVSNGAVLWNAIFGADSYTINIDGTDLDATQAETVYKSFLSDAVHAIKVKANAADKSTNDDSEYSTAVYVATSIVDSTAETLYVLADSIALSSDVKISGDLVVSSSSGDTTIDLNSYTLQVDGDMEIETDADDVTIGESGDTTGNISIGGTFTVDAENSHVVQNVVITAKSVVIAVSDTSYVQRATLTASGDDSISVEKGTFINGATINASSVDVSNSGATFTLDKDESNNYASTATSIPTLIVASGKDFDIDDATYISEIELQTTEKELDLSSVSSGAVLKISGEKTSTIIYDKSSNLTIKNETTSEITLKTSDEDDEGVKIASESGSTDPVHVVSVPVVLSSDSKTYDGTNSVVLTAEGLVENANNSYTYTYDKSKTITFTAELADANVGENKEVKFHVSDNQNQAIVSFEKLSITITPRDISNATVGDFSEMTYNGEYQTPVAIVTIGDMNATGEWSSVKNVSDISTFTASVNFTGTIKNHTTGMVQKELTVTSVSVDSKEYDGKNCATNAVVSLGGAVNNETVTATATAHWIGDEAGTSKVALQSLSIDEKFKENYMISDDAWKTAEYTTSSCITQAKNKIDNLLISDFIYTGIQSTKEITFISNFGKESVSYLYTGTAKDGAEYSSNTLPINAGSYVLTATIAETKNYVGATQTANFEITQQDISNVSTSLPDSNFIYTGSKITPSVTMQNSEFEIPQTDYILTYSNNTEIGTATVSITGQNNYKGDKSITFEIISGFTYKLLDNDTYEVSEYKGILSKVVIPPLYKDKAVTKIGSEAFMKNNYLVEITIPSSISTIGNNSFNGCAKLSSVIFEDNSNLIYSGNLAFSECDAIHAVKISNIATWCAIEFEDNFSNPLFYAKNLYVNDVSIENIEIPYGVENINDYAFYGGFKLYEITIPSSVCKIGKYACCNINLEKIYISDIAYWCEINFSDISSAPFNDGLELYLNNNSINELEIPERVSKINANAFAGFKNITSVKISGELTIEESAFSKCSNLETVNINSPISIESNAFQLCANLTNVCVENGGEIVCMAKDSFSDANLEKNDYGMTVVGGWLIDGEPNEYGVFNITEDIDHFISDFVNGTYQSVLHSENILLFEVDSKNETYKSIDGNLYSKDGKTLYKYVNASTNSLNMLPRDLENIATHAIDINNNNVILGIPSEIKTLETSAINGSVIIYNESLEGAIHDESGNVYSFDGMTVFYGATFGDNDSYVASFKITETLKNASIIFSEANYPTRTDFEFKGWSTDTNATSGSSDLSEIIKDNEVGSGIYTVWFSCKSDDHNEGLDFELINDGSQYQVKSYSGSETHVVIPATYLGIPVTKIADYAFQSCEITSVLIPEGVVEIGDNAFANCKNITSIVIPKSVEIINGSPFFGCICLEQIYCYSETNKEFWSVLWNMVSESEFADVIYQ